MPLRPAYYPGTHERYSTFVDSHADVEFFGEPAEEQLPWALIKGLDPDNSEEMCFSREPFCGVCAEMTLCVDDVESFLARAVRFVNERVWGTLGVTFLVPASVARDRITATALERSIAGLRYGTIGVNYHPSAAWVSGTTPWGGYEGADVDPTESGVGFTQNAMMLADTEKTVIRASLGGTFPPPVCSSCSSAPMWCSADEAIVEQAAADRRRRPAPVMRMDGRSTRHNGLAVQARPGRHLLGGTACRYGAGRPRAG